MLQHHHLLTSYEKFAAVQNVKLYSYKELKAATDDFSPTNKIGEGGFGPVYRGKLVQLWLVAVLTCQGYMRDFHMKEVSFGYFISDLTMILWFYPALGGMEYMLHHFLSMGGLGYAMLTGLGQFYAYMVLLSETTTPGINLRWYLDAVEKKKSNAYVVNGVATFLTWLVVRRVALNLVGQCV